MNTTVRINWQRNFDNNQTWCDVSSWAVELFGLPGDRYFCHANVDYMEFIFVSHNDALIMSLRWNARVVPEEELTVELVGSML